MAKTIRELMNREPATVPKGATAMEAARLMKDLDIGAVLVVEEDGALCGLVTDRDLAVRVMASGSDAAAVPVADICTRDPEPIDAREDSSAAVKRMSERAVRRLPVTDKGKLVGMVSLGDLAIERDPQSVLGTISAAPAQK